MAVGEHDGRHAQVADGIEDPRWFVAGIDQESIGRVGAVQDPAVGVEWSDDDPTDDDAVGVVDDFEICCLAHRRGSICASWASMTR